MAPVVKTLQGGVEGVQGHDLDGNPFYKFLGIPYARPPVGDLRFKEPQPVDSWVGVRDATKDGSSCYHKDPLTQQIEGSEDCLYLNVYTKELPTDGSYNLRPVMVFIHGGGFTSGSNSSRLYGPEFLVSEDVVLVVINYRLGYLGFLRIKDPQFNISGNMGFKDQVEALRWVKSNIQQFNGDPDNVTLFGESAGSACVHLHVLSPLSRDLFHKAILQSGSALNPWCDAYDHSAVQLAKLRDSSISTEKEAVQLLKNLSVEELYLLQEEFMPEFAPDIPYPVGLVIEPASKRTAFMTKRPIDIITSGEYNKVPLIFGYTNREGLLYIGLRSMRGDTSKVMVENYIPHNINLRKNDPLKWNYVEKLNNLYYNGPDREDGNALMMTDACFLTGIIGSVKNHSQTSAYPVYLYKMSLETQLNIFKKILNVTHTFGCSHGDDVGYLFKTFVTPPITEGSIEDVNLRRVLRLWTNFARFGNPTPDEAEFGLIWKPARSRQLNTLNIGDELRMEVNPDGKRMDLWKQIYHQSTATAKYL